jgi:hypothetical protein
MDGFDQDDLRGVVVALRIEAWRGMEPSPLQRAEGSLLTSRYGADRHTLSLRRREQCRLRSLGQRFGNGMKPLANNELADGNRSKDVAHRRVVVKVWMGHDDRVDAPHPRFGKGGQENRAAGGRRRSRSSIDDDGRRAALHQIGGPIADGEHRDGERRTGPQPSIVDEDCRERRNPNQQQEETGDRSHPRTASAAPPEGRRRRRCAPEEGSGKERQERFARRRPPSGKGDERLERRGCEPREGNREGGREDAQRRGAVTKNEHGAPERNRQNRERHGERCDSAEVPDRDGRRDKPDGNRRRQKRPGRFARPGADPIGRLDRSIPALMKRGSAMSQRDDRAEGQLEAGPE